MQEFSCLLDIEVGAPRRDGSPAEVPLQAIAKYGLPRVVTVQDPTLRELDMYRRTERAAQVRASAKALWRRREELFVVDDIDLRRMRVRGMLDGRHRSFRVESMSAEKRRLAVVEGDHGLEPMALFVGRGGRMPSRQRWEQIFDEAHLRAVRMSEECEVGFVVPRVVRIHDTRHTFAVYMLRLLTKLIYSRLAASFTSVSVGTGAGPWLGFVFVLLTELFVLCALAFKISIGWSACQLLTLWTTRRHVRRFGVVQ